MRSPELLDVLETVAAYPATPSGLSDAGAALAPALVWDRLYQWIGWRWGTSAVEWTVKGGGVFAVPLRPATVEAVAYWDKDVEDWIAVPLGKDPMGISLPFDATWKVDATCGAGVTQAPAIVDEAYRRLADYLAAAPDDMAGVTSATETVEGVMTQSFHRSSTWRARALEASGAADLLRSYRRLGRC